MIDLIHKRHPPPAWIVVDEIGNATGSSVSRHADAVAIGLWPSHGHAIHGFEVKVSRSDVKRELDDPSKADAVGKFCDFWWLVVSDLKIIDGIVIPDTWGILHPKGKILRVHRKAPQRKPIAITRGFSAALIRKVCSSWVPKWEHAEFKASAMEKAKAELQREREWKTNAAEHDLAQLRATVARFEETSGVKITQRWGDSEGTLSTWEIDRIGPAVKAVIAARETIGHCSFVSDNPTTLVKNELDGVERAIRAHETAIANRRAAAEQVRALLERMREEDPSRAAAKESEPDLLEGVA